MVFSSFGGLSVHGLFSGGLSDSLASSDSITVAIARTNVLCEAFGPALTNPANTRPHVPDVFSVANNQFRFIWSDTALTKGSATVEKIFRRDIAILPASVNAAANALAADSADTVPVKYLHAARNGNHFLVSFSQSTRNLTAVGDIGPRKMGVSTAILQGATMCATKNNSFIMAYVKGSSIVACKPIVFTGNAFDTLAEDTLAKDSSGSISWIAPSIAADSSGNLCVLWMRGNTNSPIKKIVYGVYDSLLKSIVVDSFSDNTSGPGAPNYDDNAPALSYARNKFAAVSWDTGGILLRRFEIQSPTQVGRLVDRIKSARNCRYPAITSNGASIMVSWMSYSIDKKSVHIRSMQYSINGGEIDVASPSPELSVADTTFATGILDTSKVFTQRSAMDSTGNLAFCWNMHDYAHAIILANRTLFRNSGFWTSPKDSVPIFQGDSVSFYKATVVIDPASITASAQDTLDSLFLSVDNGSSWTFFKNNTALASEVKGPYKYFNYKIKLKCIDSLTTPAIKKVSLQWKTKPRLLSLDSLKINGAMQPGLRFGDTLRCFSRCDSVRSRFGLASLDTLDTIYTGSIRKGITVPDSVNKFRGWWVSDTIYPLTKTDTIAWRFTATSKSGWAGKDSVLYILTHNAIPRLGLQVSLNGAAPVAVVGQTRINVQQTDSLDFTYSIQDSNDAGTLVRAYLNNGAIDSTGQNLPGHYRFRCVRGLPQGDVFRFTGKDPDDSAVAIVYCGVNHFPVLNGVSVKAAALKGGDTARVLISAPTQILMHGSDVDEGYGDTVRFTIRRPGVPDTVQKDSVFTWFPKPSDSLVGVFITDIAGKSDSLKFFIKFPWYAADTVANPAMAFAKKTLSDSIALVIGSGVRDTIGIPLKNTGTDTLTIISVQYKGTVGKWLRMLIPQNNTLTAFDSLLPATISPISLPPDSGIVISALLYADSLKGDHMAYDTIIIGTNDAKHAFDTLPVRLKYNDLPRLASVSFNFAINQPYWLAKSSGLKKTSYVFPPYAKITMTFSEPVDSASAVQAVKIYSLYDSLADKNSLPIPLTAQWSLGKTRLDLSPNYTQSSPYFKIKPPPGFFIPTDKLKIIVSSTLTDTAQAPNGPNAMDVHQVYARSPAADTTFVFYVDSVHYAITAVSPDSAAVGVALKPVIAIVFSSPPFPGTIDTNKTGNKTLVVGSRYSGVNQISFNSIYIKGDTAFFVPVKKFFYGDTVHCWYRGLWARDSLGYSVDLNGDGIPSSMFDTASTVDDKRWSFVIKDISTAASYPAGGAINVAPDTAVTLTFTDSVNAVVVDTSKINNRSFQAVSRCNGGAALPLSSIKLSGAKVAVRFAHKLYYGDSVFCSYNGLSTADSALFSIGGENGKTVFSKNTLQWSYRVRDINLVSALPDSSESSSTMHPEIVLRFSQPVFTGLFDFDTSARNRSIQITSPYTKDSAQALKAIAVSSDSTQITIIPKTVFFSNDSVHCVFKGLRKNLVYGKADNIPLDSEQVICSRTWYFFIQTQEFYTYPNPYKPGSNPRHCSANGPCGIIFKNLHVLKKGLNEVSVKIFNMNAFPVYATQAAGVRIRFQAGNSDLKPEWKWDTRNQHGDFVASGLYFYAVYDPAGGVLIKGKLMIVR